MKTLTQFQCVAILFAAILTLTGCKPPDHKSTTTLTLDWKPEPEFGGFYQADLSSLFKSKGLDVELKNVTTDSTWPMVAAGQTDFATTAADQVLIARSKGADVVAIFAVYQTCPQGIMVHKARGFQTIGDVFTNPGVLAAEDATWLKYLMGKYQQVKVNVIAYSGGIAAFLAKPDYSQQCFVTSEPLLAARAGGDPQTFLIADAGYNPYTTVLITRGDVIKNQPGKVKAMVLACREGWAQYLANPSPANAVMGKLNTEMDAKTFEEAAAAQKGLIDDEFTKKNGLGTMSSERWTELGRQLVELKVIEKSPAAMECFADVDKLP
jgi:NitT/TauT family transport system substrate-binding protein